MDTGAYEPYIRVIVANDPSGTNATTVQPIAYRLEALKATVRITRDAADISDLSYFRIVRGALINGTPSTISTIWFSTRDLVFDGKFMTLTGEVMNRSYQVAVADGDYQDVVEYVAGQASSITTFTYEGTAAWKAYQFYPDGKSIIVSPAMKLFTILQQKYLIFATENGFDGTDSDLFLFVATDTRATDYTIIDQLFAKNYHAETRQLLWRDEANSVHNNGGATAIRHNLGYLESTASAPTNSANLTIGSRSSKLPVHLKYRTGDKITCNGDGSGLNTWTGRANVIEVLDLESTPAWYMIIEQLVWYGGTEGGALPSTIEAAAPFTPLATGTFDGILTANDNNLQAAMETIDDHGHATHTDDHFDDTEGDPAPIGTAADGTSTNAARRDHVHGAGGIGFSAYRSTNQTINNGTFTKVQFDTEEWDIGGFYDNATNYRFQPTVAGKYLITSCISFPTAGGIAIALAYKNGARFKDGNTLANTALGTSSTVSAEIDMNGSSDYVEIFTYQSSGGPLALTGNQNSSWFQTSLQR
jgi:hypothetical protein